VVVTGGASAGRPCLQDGLVDEMQPHVAVLLGGGIALFAGIDARRLELASTRTVQTAAVTHLRFAVRRR
jgi:dihydrofolate reductase